MYRGIEIKKALGLLLCLFIITGLFSACTINNRKGQNETKAVNITKSNIKESSFLKKNYSDIDVLDNNDFSTLKLLDSALEDKEVFFTAENHGVVTNSELELKFVKYLKNKAGIKYLLCEISYSDGQVLNKYLNSGDESILEELYKPLKGTFAWNKQSYNYWEKLYEYNKSLSEDQKLKVVGIDIEHQYVNAIRYMNSLIPDKKAPNEIKGLVLKVNEIYNKINIEQYADADETFANALDQSIKDNHKIYEEYFGENLFDFELVNENIIAQVKAYKGKDNMSFNQIRDAKMYDNFKKIYKLIPKGKFYGQFGLNHAFQKNQANVDWVASLMNSSDSPVRGKILSIVYLYDSCEEMMNGDYRTEILTTYLSNDRSLDSFAKKDITLFKLTGKDSPFEKELIWPFCSDAKDDPSIEGVTTDYFQYMVLIKNGKATIPLDR